MKRLSTNYVFAEFASLIDRCREWYGARSVAACGFEATVLVDRLSQRTVELAVGPFNVAVKRAYAASAEWPPAAFALPCPAGTIDTATGSVAISLKWLIRSEIEFVTHWLYALLGIVSPRLTGPPSPPGVLLHDLGDETLFHGGSDRHFSDYCRQSAIEPLRSGRRFFIESLSGTPSCEPDRFAYSRRPLIRLLRETPLGVTGRVSVLIEQLWLFVQYHAALLRMPFLALLPRDLAYSAVARALDRRGRIDAIVVTCATWGSQPLWMRSLRRTPVHMIWYSQNPQSASYVTDTVKSNGPQLRWMRADTHWVWTHAFARYLREQGGMAGRIEVVGPIVWQLPEQGQRSPAAIRVVIFDVPAVSDEIMLEIAGEVTNYYQAANLRRFIEDIVSLRGPVEAALGRPVSLELKMKRGARPHYAREHFDFVDRLFAEGQLAKAPFDANLHRLISASDLVIAYPFTSPAYLAEHLGVPAIFYDATATLVREEFCDTNLIRFVNQREQLLPAVLELLAPASRTAPASAWRANLAG